MSGRVGVEQTPDIEAIAAVIREHRSILSGDVDGWHLLCQACGDLGITSNERTAAAHVAQALAPVLAAAVREARAAELREAADDMPFGYSHAAHILRDRADRIKEDR
jgi:hypothetical protein